MARAALDVQCPACGAVGWCVKTDRATGEKLRLGHTHKSRITKARTMSKSHIFTMSVACDNDAFEPEPWEEIARILRDAADKIERERDACRWFQTVRDVNGNDVGRFALKHADYLAK